jgi:glycogen operon protein
VNHQGQFPSGWSEWNGSFRDTIRRAQNELGVVPTSIDHLFARLEGSPDLFAGRAPNASVNFIDCHDGFTLHDVYAYDRPNNAQPWPFGPSNGGSTSNDAWDQGGHPEAQRRAARTGLLLTVVAAGVPMIQGGDEMLRTVRGNNNPYDLDSPANWLDWSLAGPNADFVAFTRKALLVRGSHPVLRPRAFRDGKDHDGNGRKDVTRLDAPANTLAYLLDGAEAGDAAAAVYIAYNFGASSVTLALPPAHGAWTIGAESAIGTREGPLATGEAKAFELPSRAAVVLFDE